MQFYSAVVVDHKYVSTALIVDFDHGIFGGNFFLCCMIGGFGYVRHILRSYSGAGNSIVIRT